MFTRASRSPRSSDTEHLASEPMSSVDTAWLRMEELVNQMTITGVLTFREPLRRDDFKQVIKKRFLRFDRFRQRVRRGRSFRNPRWEEDPNFDLDHHVRTAQLPAPGGKAQLQELASALMSRPLDFSRPLWEFHVVEGYEEGGAVIARLHHCIADGVTLVRVLLSLTDSTPEAPPGGASGESMANALADVLGDAGVRSENGAETKRPSVAQRVATTLKRAGREGMCAAELAARGVGVLGKLAWPTPDSDTILRGELGRAKRAAWSEPIPLADVKAVGNVLGGTVNDVLVTALTGALRRYLQERGEPTAGLDVRAAVPVNLRPLDAPLTMGNGFGLVFLSLPVGLADPFERLKELRRRMDRLKRSPEAAVLLGILGAVGAAPQAVEEQVVTYLARKVTAVATNVPGPRQQLYLAGAPLETLMAWVPQAGRVGLGASIISYDGQVRLGMATDENIVPRPGAIIDVFYREFDALLERAPGEERATEERSAEEEAASRSPVSPSRCQATTKAGTQCKLPAQEASSFCHVHQ